MGPAPRRFCCARRGSFPRTATSRTYLSSTTWTTAGRLPWSLARWRESAPEAPPLPIRSTSARSKLDSSGRSASSTRSCPNLPRSTTRRIGTINDRRFSFGLTRACAEPSGNPDAVERSLGLKRKSPSTIRLQAAPSARRQNFGGIHRGDRTSFTT